MAESKAPASKPATVATGPDAGGNPAAEVARLREEVARLQEENDRLREAGDPAEASAAARRRAPEPASFGLSEGTRLELQERGETTDPFTGKRVTRDDFPDHDTQPVERDRDRGSPKGDTR
jgi:hypothetical protein